MSHIVPVEKCFHWMTEAKRKDDAKLLHSTLWPELCIQLNFYFCSTKSIYPFQDIEKL